MTAEPIAGVPSRIVAGLRWLLGEALPRTAPEPGSVALLAWCTSWAALGMFLGDHYAVRGPTPLANGVYRLGVHGALPLASLAVWELWRAPRARVVGGVGIACMLAPLVLRMTAEDGAELLIAAPVFRMLVPFALGAILVRVALGMAAVDVARWGMGMGEWRWWAPRTAFMAACVVPLCLAGALLSPQLLAYYPRWKPAQTDGALLALYFTALFIDLYGWEFLWRAFLLNALARRGDPILAVFGSAIPFFLLHYPKPDLEMLSSFPGGILAGWFCLRARSSFPLWILHCVLFGTMGTIGFLARRW